MHQLEVSLMVEFSHTMYKKRITDEFNKFYVNIGLSLAKRLPKSDMYPISFICESNMHSMGITAVTKEELFQIFNNLKDSSAGCDDSAACVVKSTYEYNYWCIVNTPQNCKEKSQKMRNWTHLLSYISLPKYNRDHMGSFSQPVPNVEKFRHSLYGQYQDSLQASFQGFLGTLPGDSSINPQTQHPT